MKTYKFLFLGIAISSLLACAKDTNNTTTTSSSLVKTQDLAYPNALGLTITYIYDSQNRLKLTKYSSGDSIVIEYTNNIVTQKKYDALGVLKITSVYYLNSQGLIDTAVENNGDQQDKISYDGNGYQTTFREYDQNGTLAGIHYFTIDNGNVTVIKTTDAVGNVLSNQTSSFDLTKLNSLGSNNSGQSYLGKSSVNIAVHTVTTSGSSNQIVYDRAFEFDAKGRISKIITNSATALISTATFTYY